MERLMMMAVAAVAILLLGIVRWRFSLKLFFVLVIIEGALRKWFLPELQAGIYVARDLMLVGVYLGFLFGPNRLWLPEPMRPWIVATAAAAFVGALQIFNPELPSALLGVVGWKTYFLYLPIALLLPHLYPTREEFLVALKRYLLLTVPVAILALFQFAAPPEHILNASVAHEVGEVTDIPTFHDLGRARVSGTFSFIGGMTAYLTVMGMLCLALVTETTLTRRDRWQISLSLASVIGAMFMSGSRAPIASIVAGMIVFAVFGARFRLLGMRALFQLAASAVIGVVLLAWFFEEAADAWLYRTTEGVGEDTILGRIIWPIMEPFDQIDVGGAFGIGIGGTHNAAGFLTGYDASYSDRILRLAEGEPARVMLEMGVLGFLLLYASRVAAIVAIIGCARRMGDSISLRLVAGVVALLIVLLPAQIAINPTFGGLYAGVIGIPVALLYFSQSGQAVPAAASRSVSRAAQRAHRSWT